MSRTIVRLLDFDEEEIPVLETSVAIARDRLADLLAEHGTLRGKIEKVLAIAFEELGSLREKQELLETRLALLTWRLQGMVAKDPEVEDFEQKWEDAQEKVSRRYGEARSGIEEKKNKEPEGARGDRLKKVWKNLVRLYHPDKHHNDPHKREKYEKLLAVVNRAKEEGDLETLEKIAEDPEGFARKQGWDVGNLNGDSSKCNNADRVRELRELLQSLNEEILKVEVEINELRSSDDYALYELWKSSRSQFRKSIDAMTHTLTADIERLSGEIDDLERRIGMAKVNFRKCA